MSKPFEIEDVLRKVKALLEAAAPKQAVPKQAAPPAQPAPTPQEPASPASAPSSEYRRPSRPTEQDIARKKRTSNLEDIQLLMKIIVFFVICIGFALYFVQKSDILTFINPAK